MAPLAEILRLAVFGSSDLGALVALVLSIGAAGVVLILLNIKK